MKIISLNHGTRVFKFTGLLFFLLPLIGRSSDLNEQKETTTTTTTTTGSPPTANREEDITDVQVVEISYEDDSWSMQAKDESGRKVYLDGQLNLWEHPGILRVKAPVYDVNEVDEDVWTARTWVDINYHLGCKDPEGHRAITHIYKESTWELLHSTYQEVVHAQYSNFAKKADGNFVSGFKVKQKVKVVPGNRWGVFAAEDIPMGTLVWQSENTMQFVLPSLYYEFMQSIPVHLACDIHFSSYPTLDEGDNTNICTDLDERLLVNENHDSNNPDANIGEVQDPIGCHYELYALVDIKAGEELIVNVHHEEEYYEGGYDDEKLENDDADLDFFTNVVDHDEDYGYDGDNLEDEDSDEEDEYRRHGEDGFDVWKDGTMSEIMLHLGCENLVGDTVMTQIYNQSTWELLQSTYRKVVPPQYSKSFPKADEKFSHGFKVKYEVKISPGKGRGVFAAEDIAMGTLVWQSVNAAQFYLPTLFREFLRSLPVHLACDVHYWSYTVRDSGDYISICTDLDEGTLINGDYESANIGEPVKGSGCFGKVRALVDIKAGEEFILDYDEFAEHALWDEMGLGFH